MKKIVLAVLSVLALTAPAAAFPCVDPAHLIPKGCTPLTGNLGNDVKVATTPAGSPLKALLEMLTNTDDAIALSTSIPQVQDPVGGSCWKSAGGISAVVKAHPDVLTGKVAADLEALRLVHIALNQICANPNCGQMWNDLQNVQAALQPAPLPLSFTSLCAKIPVIGTAAAQSAPPLVAPTSTTSPKP